MLGKVQLSVNSCEDETLSLEPPWGGLYLWALQSEDLELGPKRSTATSPGLYPKDQFIFCRGYL